MYRILGGNNCCVSTNCAKTRQKKVVMGCTDRCANLGLELVLVCFTVFLTVGFIITYIVAVQQNHVTPDLPYISDTGGKVPESCIFSFVCSIGAIFILAIVCVRFKQLHHYYHRTVKGMHCLNVFGLVLGVISVVGLLLVGSFQNDNVPIVHFIGAFLVFGFGVAYSWLQTLISYRICRAGIAEYVGCCTVIFRLILCVISTLMFVTAIVGAVFASKYHVNSKNSAGSFFWEPEDGGFTLHVVSTAAEWLAGLSFLLFFLTFHPDFTRIELNFAVKLKYRHHSDVIQRESILNADENTPLTI